MPSGKSFPNNITGDWLCQKLLICGKKLAVNSIVIPLMMVMNHKNGQRPPLLIAVISL